MSSKVKFELNSDGVKALLKSSEMQSLLKQKGNEKASAAGEGYASDVVVHSNRAVAYIYPEDAKAKRDNLDNNTLLKVIGS